MSASREETVALYEALVATQPDFKIKGAANLYTSLNGHMFSFITKEGQLAIRLPKDAQEAFMEEHGTGPVVQYGAVMRGYVEVPHALLANTTEIAELFADSIAYIASLKPKPTTRKKPAAKKNPAAKRKSSPKKK